MHSAHILPKPARFGCMAAIYCQEGALFPSEAPSGTHEVEKPPRIAARECIAAISCHGRTLGNAWRRYIATVGRRGNAFREHFAIGERPGMHRGGMMPRPAPRGCTTAICCHGKVFRGYAAEICCRCLSERHWRAAAMKEPGVLEGASTPPPRVGHLRCARPLVHAPQCFREVGALRSLRGAVCVSAPSSQGHGVPWVDPGWRQPRGLSWQGRGSPFSAA